MKKNEEPTLGGNNIVLTLDFHVKDPSEEHSIIRKFLCSTCIQSVRFKSQRTMEVDGRTFGADRIICECDHCAKEYEFFFYLPTDYQEQFNEELKKMVEQRQQHNSNR